MEWSEALAEIKSEFRSALSALARSRGPEYDTPRPVVLARVEDERSDFPAEQRIPRSLFADLVATYDPDRRMAPVVVGFFDGDSTLSGNARPDAERVVAGPSHYVGEYLPPLGFIRGTDWHLDHDHLNLYGMVTQIVDADGGRIDRMVARGFLQRSIAYVPKTNETGGKPDLWHFAVLGGEQPGIPNMPSLARTFGLELGQRAHEWKALGLTARALQEVNYRTLSILDGMHEESEMTPEDRAALAKELAGALAGVVSPLVDSINKATAEQKTALVDLGASLRAEVKTVEAKADTAADDAKKASDKAKADQAKRYADRAIALVKSGRCQPAQVQRVVQAWTEHTPDEAKDAALEALESLPVRDAAGRTPTEIKVEGQRPAFVDFEERYTIPGLRQTLDPVEVETMSGLMASVLHLPFAERKSALNRAIEAHYGGPSASGLGF